MASGRVRVSVRVSSLTSAIMKLPKYGKICVLWKVFCVVSSQPFGKP